MNAWEIVGVTHDGEIVCPSCFTEEERDVAEQEKIHDEIHVVFASDVDAEEESCSRCSKKLME